MIVLATVLAVALWIVAGLLAAREADRQARVKSAIHRLSSAEVIDLQELRRLKGRR